MTNKYILKSHQAIPVEDVSEWGQWLERAGKKRIVKQETLTNGLWVSTVFLGLDYNFLGRGKPLLFETMVFPKGSSGEELDMDRYSTWEEAEEGHKKMVKKYATGRGRRK